MSLMIRFLFLTLSILIGIQTCILHVPAHADTALESLFTTRLEDDYFEAVDLYERGQYSRALRKVERFLDDYPYDRRGQMLKAWTLLKMNNLDDAKGLLNIILEHDPSSIDALVATGIYYRKVGEPKTAMAYYQRVLDMNPNSPEALNSLVPISLESGDIKKAVHFGKRAYLEDPNNPIINANLAIAYHYDDDFVNRDIHKKRAQDLGYNDMRKLYSIFSGKETVIPKEESLEAAKQ